MDRYKLKDGGAVVDDNGKIVAVDADAGIASHSFKDLENVSVLRWDTEAELVFQKCLEFDKNAQGPEGVAKALKLQPAKVRSLMSHPAFIRRLQTEQAKGYTAVGIMRRNSIASLLDKVIIRAVDLLDTATLDQTGVKLLSNLLREARALRQQERLEHGEASQLIAGFMKVDSGGMEQSVKELLMKHADIAGALANYLLNVQQGKDGSPRKAAVGTPTEASYQDITSDPNEERPASESVSIIESLLGGIGTPPAPGAAAAPPEPAEPPKAQPSAPPPSGAFSLPSAPSLAPSPFGVPGVPSLDMEPMPDVSSGSGGI